MRAGLNLLLIAVFCFSCNDGSSVPAGVIKPEQMKNLLWDIIRGDLLAQELIRKDSTKTLKNESFAISEKIFSIHRTSRKNFENSMTFYEKHPELIKIIFDSLNAEKSRRNPTSIERKLLHGKEYHLSPTGNVKVP